VVSCEQHDYLEIVCLYHYPVRLTLDSGVNIEGVASDIVYQQQVEKSTQCLELKQSEGRLLIELDKLVKMEVLVDNPHFKIQRFI
jgi:Rho-binding antiterminator